MSVRTRPPREAIAAAEFVYRRFRENRAGKARFHKRLIIRTGLVGRISIIKIVPWMANTLSGSAGQAAAKGGKSGSVIY